MPQYDVDLRDYWRIIKKRKTIIILMVILVAIFSYGFAKFKEPAPVYEATCSIKIEEQTNLAALLTGSYWYPGESIITHAHIITSFPVLTATAKTLGWLSTDLNIDEMRQSQKALSVVQRLKEMILPEHEQNTNIINIQTKSENPEEAALVANTAAGAYQAYNLDERNRRTRETKKFIEDQLRTTSMDLKRAEAELLSFKEGYGLISVDEQTRNNLNRLFSVQAELDNIKAQRKDIVNKLNMLRAISAESVGSLEKSMFTVTRDSQIFELRKKMSDLFLERQTLLIYLTEQHPQVIEVDDEIKAVAAEIRNELNAQLRTLKANEINTIKRRSQLQKESQALPEKAMHLIRLEREVDIQEALYSQLKTKYQETLIQESGKVAEVTIVRPAVVPDHAKNIPSKMIVLITGLVLGLIIGIVVAFGAEVFDTSMGTIEDVEESLQVPVLGVIPYLGKDDKERKEKALSEKERARDLIMHYDPKSLAAEAFRSLRTNLLFMSQENQGKTFLITSAFVREGKTLNVINTALSMAQTGERVLLVEADLRKPVIYTNFGLSKEPGLTDFVLGNYHWKEVVNNITDVMLGEFEMDEILKTPGLDNLHIITSGTRPPNPSEILGSDLLRKFIDEVSQEYSYVFIDAPPILPVADATEIAPMVDGVIMVYTVGKIARGVLKRAKSSLDNIDAKVLGVILNNVKPEVGPDYFKYNTQYYYGSAPEKDIKA